MSYFIFLKNFDNTEGVIYKIAENQSDLNNLNINQADYKIIEESISNFNDVKLGNKFPKKYNNDTITHVNQTIVFNNKNELQNYIDNLKQQIKQFTDNNPNHTLFSRWNNYYIQLNNLNLEVPTYPLNKSLEQYFNDLGQPSLNILQLP
jgi:mRNA-degrading endonuclease YafQ of YafQ-DinJ toxin-antitoxin module